MWPIWGMVEPHYSPVGTMVASTIQNYHFGYINIKVNCKISTYNLENLPFRHNVEHILKIWKTRIIGT